MAKKKAICTNIDCTEYKKVVELETGAEMICPCCHQPMKSVENAKGSSKKGNAGSGKGKIAAIAVIAAAVLGGGGYGIYSAMGGDEAPKTIEPMAAPAPVDTVAKDTVKVDTVKPEPKVEAEPEVKEPEKKAPVAKKPMNGRGTVNLGYATYTGDLKNGKPHGYGVLTYHSRHRIVPSKDFYANAGDTFEGDFRDGRISGIGYWKHDGSTTAVKP